MNNISTNVGSPLLNFTFTAEDGEVLASFRMNPADVKLAKRCQEVSEFFENLGEEMPETVGLDEVVRLNDELEDKICYLLGYDAKNSLFGQISATTIMEDGNMFAVHVMKTITEKVAPVLAKRKQAMAAAVAKHTEKYGK